MFPKTKKGWAIAGAASLAASYPAYKAADHAHYVITNDHDYSFYPNQITSADIEVLNDYFKDSAKNQRLDYSVDIEVISEEEKQGIISGAEKKDRIKNLDFYSKQNPDNGEDEYYYIPKLKFGNQDKFQFWDNNNFFNRPDREKQGFDIAIKINPPKDGNIDDFLAETIANAELQLENASKLQETPYRKHLYEIFTKSEYGRFALTDKKVGGINSILRDTNYLKLKSTVTSGNKEVFAKDGNHPSLIPYKDLPESGIYLSIIDKTKAANMVAAFVYENPDMDKEKSILPVVAISIPNHFIAFNKDNPSQFKVLGERIIFEELKYCKFRIEKLLDKAVEKGLVDFGEYLDKVVRSEGLTFKTTPFQDSREGKDNNQITR